MRLRPAIPHLDEYRQAALALDPRADGAGIAGALDEIALPVAGKRSRLDVFRALVDRNHADQATAFLLPGVAGAARFFGLAKQADDFLTDFAARQDIDRPAHCLVRNVGQLGAGGVIALHLAQFAGNLLRRPAQPQTPNA